MVEMVPSCQIATEALLAVRFTRRCEKRSRSSPLDMNPPPMFQRRLGSSAEAAKPHAQVREGMGHDVWKQVPKGHLAKQTRRSNLRMRG